MALGGRPEAKTILCPFFETSLRTLTVYGDNSKESFNNVPSKSMKISFLVIKGEKANGFLDTLQGLLSNCFGFLSAFVKNLDIRL